MFYGRSPGCLCHVRRASRSFALDACFASVTLVAPLFRPDLVDHNCSSGTCFLTSLYEYKIPDLLRTVFILTVHAMVSALKVGSVQYQEAPLLVVLLLVNRTNIHKICFQIRYDVQTCSW